MLVNIAIAAILILATTMIHAGGMVLVLGAVRRHTGALRKPIYWVGGTVLLMVFVLVAEALLWALTYLALGALSGFEKAFYFSMVTFATLGYGDVVLGEQWRLLSSFEAVNGIIMFGWTTAIVIYAIQQIYTKALKIEQR